MTQSTASKVIKVTTGQFALEGAVLGRQILIAHLLGAETLGGFLLVMLAWRAALMVSEMALDRFLLVQQGDSALATIQTLNLARMALVAMGLFIVCHTLKPIDGYIWIAAACLIKGWQNLSYRVALRDGDPAAFQVIEVWPTIAFLPAYGITGFLQGAAADLAALLCLQSAIEVTLSHLKSNHRFLLGWDKKIIKAAITFAWPLWLSGLLMFGSLYLERLAFADRLDIAVFAGLAIALQLAQLPIQVLGRVALVFGLPFISKATSNPLDRLRFETMGVLAGLAICVGFILAAPHVLPLVFDLQVGTDLILLIAIAQGLRCLRIAGSVTAQARKKTHIPLIANGVRIAGVLAAVPAFLTMGDPAILLSAGVVAEIAALIIQHLLLFQAPKREKSYVYRPNTP